MPLSLKCLINLSHGFRNVLVVDSVIGEGLQVLNVICGYLA